VEQGASNEARTPMQRRKACEATADGGHQGVSSWPALALRRARIFCLRCQGALVDRRVEHAAQSFGIAGSNGHVKQQVKCEMAGIFFLYITKMTGIWAGAECAWYWQ
jgi:hypothetical protein